MGDSLEHVYDLYEDYKLLCKKHNIEPLDINYKGYWYKHFLELDELERRDNE